MTPDQKIEKILAENQDIWKTYSVFMSYIRGGVRRGLWEKHPVKLKYIKNHRIMIPNPNPKGKKLEVWGGRCEVCNNLFIQKDLQVDHIRDDSASLRCFDDVQYFIENMVLVTEDDLRLVCKPCHSIISYSQSKNLSFEDAKVEKMFIQIKKENKVIDKLLEFGVEYENIPKLKKDRESLLHSLLVRYGKKRCNSQS